MTEEDRLVEATISNRLMQLNAPITGVVVGVICGLGLCIATLFLVIKGGDVVGPHLGLLEQFFWGYRVTIIGSFVGLFYGFVVGFGMGCLTALLYNLLIHFRERQKPLP